MSHLPYRRLAGLALLAGPLAAAACGAFDETPPVIGSDVDGGDAAATDGGPDAPGEGNAPVDPDVTCVAALAPTCTLASCPRTPLYTPDAPAFPFAIATDATHVFWIEQAVATDAYDGRGTARIRRVPKAGGAVVDLATDQPWTVSLARVGDRIYWTTYTGSVAKLWSAVRDDACAPACAAPRPETEFEPGIRISHLGRAGRSALYAMGEAGHLYRVDVGGASSRSGVLTVIGAFPSLTTTPTHAYVSAMKTPRIDRFGTSPKADDGAWARLVDAGPELGPSPIAHDCAGVWGLHARAATGFHDLVRFDLATPQQVVVARTGQGAFHLAADAAFVYAARADGGGVYAWDKGVDGGAERQVAVGNVWHVSVDDDGVYWAEHGNREGTAAAGGTLMMLRKR